MVSHLRALVVLGGSLLALAVMGWVVWAVAAGPKVESFNSAADRYYLPANQPALPATPVAPKSKPRAVSSGVPRVSENWITQMALATGIPTTALRAYGRAQLEEPATCHLGWTTLAAIGEVETGHGEGAGATLYPNGMSLPTIVSSGHAFGPMQFIASTWDQWKTDGDGDGWARIDDIDDAAASAMRYLCSYGDLETGDDWARAIFGYNHSKAYVLSVYSAATQYNTLSTIS